MIKGHTGKVLILAPDSAGERSVGPEAARAGRGADGRLPAAQPAGRGAPPRGSGGRPGSRPTRSTSTGTSPSPTTPTRSPTRSSGRRSGELLSERLDHTRPLWRLDVLPLTGGRAAIVGRIHHAMADGVSAIKLAAGLLWDRDVETPNPHAARRRPAPRRRRPRRRRPPPAPRRSGSWSGCPSALWRELRPGRDTTLDQHIGPAREVAWSSFPLERLKRIGHSAPEGATVNDVVLAVVAGALAPLAAAGRRDRRRTSGSSARSACTPARRRRESSATATRS